MDHPSGDVLSNEYVAGLYEDLPPPLQIVNDGDVAENYQWPPK